MQFSFGLSEAVPTGKEAAWGARWIYPNDMLPDRQHFHGHSTPEGQKLMTWLNSGAIRKAKARAEEMDDNYDLNRGDGETVTLYEDETGIIQANPKQSHGYLYVAAWVKEGGR